MTAHLEPALYDWLQGYRAKRGLPTTAAALRDLLGAARLTQAGGDAA